mgnify:CR=1 FL=1
MVDLSHCKIKLAAGFIPQDYSVYYLRTSFKTRACNETAKFLYTAMYTKNDTFDNLNNASMDKQTAFFIKVCVPVDR